MRTRLSASGKLVIVLANNICLGLKVSYKRVPCDLYGFKRFANFTDIKLCQMMTYATSGCIGRTWLLRIVWHFKSAHDGILHPFLIQCWKTRLFEYYRSYSIHVETNITHAQASKAGCPTHRSTPRKLFIFIIKQHVNRIKVSFKHVIHVYNNMYDQCFFLSRNIG